MADMRAIPDGRHLGEIAYRSEILTTRLMWAVMDGKCPKTSVGLASNAHHLNIHGNDLELS